MDVGEWILAKLAEWLEEDRLWKSLRRTVSSAGKDRQHIMARARAYVAKEPPAVAGEQGHNRTFHVACVLVCGFGLSEAEAFEAIQDWNQTCKPPWSERELQHKIQDAGKQPGPRGHLLTERHKEDRKEATPKQDSHVTPRMYRLPELLSMEIPPPNWAVPGLLSEGLSILAGKPKLGKSWMALNLAVTLAAGGKALGSVFVEPADVLYLSLEDKIRRVQDRARKLLAGTGQMVSDRLTVAVEWPRQSDGGLEAIAEWAKGCSRPTLVIVDVWAKFRPPEIRGASAYQQDYEAASAFKSAVDKLNMSAVAVHHCRKMKAEDVMDEISGTSGFAGAADGYLVLERARNENEGNLSVSGRDVDERKLSVRFDLRTFAWSIMGKADEFENSKIMSAVVSILERRKELMGAPEMIVACASLDPPIKSENSIRSALYRLVDKGTIQKFGQKYVMTFGHDAYDPLYEKLHNY